MFEVEQKFHLDDADRLRKRLAELGAVAGSSQDHSDTYYRHPCRDFAQTNEALRIRRIDSVASVTYKGKKLPQADADLKARKELEWV